VNYLIVLAYGFGAFLALLAVGTAFFAIVLSIRGAISGKR
jgi:hypothetical protein